MGRYSKIYKTTYSLVLLYGIYKIRDYTISRVVGLVYLLVDLLVIDLYSYQVSPIVLLSFIYLFFITINVYSILNNSNEGLDS